MNSELPPALQLFPHPELRSYQSRFLRFIEKHPKVIIHAPVGFGKTLMSLISTLPLVRSTDVKTPQFQLWIFVRTKTQIFHVFLKEISKIANSKKYGYLTAVPLINKADLCVRLDKIPHFHRGVCVHIRCPLLEKARSIPEEDLPAIVEQIPITSHDGEINIESFKESLSYFGCPYYVVKRVIPYSNIIVTTHTYLRNKTLQDMLFRMLSSSSFVNKVCIIDEAHNFSADFEAEISLSDINKARSVIPLKVFDTLQELIQNRNGKVDRPKNLSSNAIDAFLDHQSKLSIWEKSNLYSIKDFLEARGDYWISESEKLLQLNPFPHSNFTFVNNNFEKIILMSGTFLPLNSYKILYGINNYSHLRIPSDFQYSLNGIMYHRRFTSRYRERSIRNYKAMASVIERLHQANPFHTVVFAASHDLKQQIHAFTSFSDKYIEKPGEPLNYIDELAEKNHECIFGVIGGRLSEGVEILHPQTKRSLLTLIIIAGIPFSRPDATNHLIKNLYAKRWGMKMADHLTRLPITRGITQSIGRGIRSETDFAASLILDFRAVNLRTMLPPVRIFREVQGMYNAYDIFFSKMRNLFNIET